MKLKTGGKDLIEGFKQGIMNKISSLTSGVTSVANTIRGLLHFSRPDERTIKRL